MSYIHLYDDILDDEWVNSLPLAERYAFIMLLVHSSKDRGCIKTKSASMLAYRIRAEQCDMQSLIDKCVESGKFEETDNGYVIKNFSKYNRDPKNSERQARFRARHTVGFVEDIDRRNVYNRYDGYCAHCGEKVEYADMHIDHIIPMSKGGKHEYSNVCCSCKECNLRKTNKLLSPSAVTGVTRNNDHNESNATKTKTKTILRESISINSLNSSGEEERVNNTLTPSAFKTKWNDFVDYLRETFPKSHSSKISVLGPGQIDHLNAKLKQPGFDLDKIFEEVKQSSFLRGEIPPTDGHKQFKWNFEFLFVRADSWAKILNGNYRDEPEDLYDPDVAELEADIEKGRQYIAEKMGTLNGGQ